MDNTINIEFVWIKDENTFESFETAFVEMAHMGRFEPIWTNETPFGSKVMNIGPLNGLFKCRKDLKASKSLPYKTEGHLKIVLQ